MDRMKPPSSERPAWTPEKRPAHGVEDETKEGELYVLLPSRSTLLRIKDYIAPTGLKSFTWKKCFILIGHTNGVGLISVYRKKDDGRHPICSGACPLSSFSLSNVIDVQGFTLPQSQSLAFGIDRMTEYRFGHLGFEMTFADKKSIKMCCSSVTERDEWIRWFTDVIVCALKRSLHCDEKNESIAIKFSSKPSASEIDSYITNFLKPLSKSKQHNDSVQILPEARKTQSPALDPVSLQPQNVDESLGIWTESPVMTPTNLNVQPPPTEFTKKSTTEDLVSLVDVVNDLSPLKTSLTLQPHEVVRERCVLDDPNTPLDEALRPTDVDDIDDLIAGLEQTLKSDVDSKQPIPSDAPDKSLGIRTASSHRLTTVHRPTKDPLSVQPQNVDDVDDLLVLKSDVDSKQPIPSLDTVDKSIGIQSHEVVRERCIPDDPICPLNETLRPKDVDDVDELIALKSDVDSKQPIPSIIRTSPLGSSHRLTTVHRPTKDPVSVQPQNVDDVDDLIALKGDIHRKDPSPPPIPLTASTALSPEEAALLLEMDELL